MTEFSLLMSNVDAQLTKLSTTMDAMIDRVNSVCAKVPGFLSHLLKPLQDAFNAFIKICSKAWTEFRDFIAHTGDASKLKEAKETLSDKVQGPITAQAGKFTTGYMNVDNHWKGKAAEEYKKVLEPNGAQSSALRQYGETVKNLCEALDKCHSALIVFWVAFFAALLTAIAALIAAIVGVISVVGAIPSLLYAVGVVGTLILAVVGAATYAYSEMSEAATTMRNENNGNDHLPNMKWPPSGVAQT